MVSYAVTVSTSAHVAEDDTETEKEKGTNFTTIAGYGHGRKLKGKSPTIL